jgi:hypothetical protein
VKPMLRHEKKAFATLDTVFFACLIPRGCVPMRVHRVHAPLLPPIRSNNGVLS